MSVGTAYVIHKSRTTNIFGDNYPGLRDFGEDDFAKTGLKSETFQDFGSVNDKEREYGRGGHITENYKNTYLYVNDCISEKCNLAASVIEYQSTCQED